MANTTVGPAITSANAAKPVPGTGPGPAPAAHTKSVADMPNEVRTQVEKLAASIAEDESVEVAPLIIPDFVNIKPRSPNVRFRWILHTLYMKDGGQSSLRFEQAKSQGYAVATQADCINPPMAYARDGGSKFINGDLILMKIDRRRYDGALLFKDQQAVKQMLAVNGKPGQTSVIKEVSAQQHRNGKISAFNPTLDELKDFDSATGDDVDPQRL